MQAAWKPKGSSSGRTVIDTPSGTRYTLRMFSFSASHLIVVAIVLIIFGPRRIPELGRSMGRAYRNFRDALSGIEEATYRSVTDPFKETKKPQDSSPKQVAASEESEKGNTPS